MYREASSAGAGTGGVVSAGGRGNRGGEHLPLPTSKIGLWLFMASATLLFSLVLSAYIVRMGFGDWEGLHEPGILGSTPLVLVAPFMDPLGAGLHGAHVVQELEPVAGGQGVESMMVEVAETAGQSCRYTATIGPSAGSDSRGRRRP